MKSELIFAGLCGCCFAELRQYRDWGVTFGVYLNGLSIGEMAMRAGAINAVLWGGCDAPVA